MKIAAKIAISAFVVIAVVATICIYLNSKNTNKETDVKQPNDGPADTPLPEDTSSNGNTPPSDATQNNRPKSPKTPHDDNFQPTNVPQSGSTWPADATLNSRPQSPNIPHDDNLQSTNVPKNSGTWPANNTPDNWPLPSSGNKPEINLKEKQKAASNRQHASSDNKGGARKMEIGDVLIICTVEDGFGDIIWAINLANELKEISTAKVTYLFSSVRPEVEKHLAERSEFSSFKTVGSFDEVVAVENKSYLYKEEVSDGTYVPLGSIENIELEAFLKKYELIVIFLSITKSYIVSNPPKGVVVVNEYGFGDNMSKIFFKDYKAIYKGMIDEQNGYMKLKVSAEEFREHLPEKRKEGFRLDYIEELEGIINGRPYYFAYQKK